MRTPMMRRGRGFSLVELLMTLAIMAVAAMFLPWAFDQTTSRNLAAAQRLANDIRYAQRLATASHQSCSVAIAGGGQSYSVLQGSSTAIDPGSWDPLVVTLDPGVRITVLPATASSVTFDVRGRPNAAVEFTIGAYKVSVKAETGAVERP